MHRPRRYRGHASVPPVHARRSGTYVSPRPVHLHESHVSTSRGYVSRPHFSPRSIYALRPSRSLSAHSCDTESFEAHYTATLLVKVLCTNPPSINRIITASRQDTREARAEAHSRRAAEELALARDEHLAKAEADARTAADEIAHARSDRSVSSGGGIFEGAKNFMSTMFGGATDTAADKTSSQTARATGDRLGEYGSHTADKARETNDSVARKTNETAEATKNKLGEYKDAAVEKAVETKDAVAQKAGEAAEATKNKLGEYKDAAAHKAQEAMDVTADKAKAAKDATAQKAQETKDATLRKAQETKDATARKAQETRDATADKAREARDVTNRKAGEYADVTRGTAQEARDRTRATAQTAADKARETAGGTHDADRSQGPGLLGALGNVTGALKDKLTLGGGGGEHQQPEVRLGGEDEQRVKERAAEKAAEVYFEEKDRLTRERAAAHLDRCVEKCVEGCADSASCTHRHGGKM